MTLRYLPDSKNSNQRTVQKNNVAFMESMKIHLNDRKENPRVLTVVHER